MNLTEIIDELKKLTAEHSVTGVEIHVHRGPLSKSIREYGECSCPTYLENDIVFEVQNEHI